jgi:hypothetical protein
VFLRFAVNSQTAADYQTALRGDSPICSKPDSLLLQQEAACFTPVGHFACMPSDNPGTEEKKSQRKRSGPSNTWRVSGQLARSESRLFFAARAVSATSY